MPKFFAEALGTFFLIFFGTGAIVVGSNYSGALTHEGVCVVFGLIVMAVVYAIGHISGAHINPAVTIGFASVRRLSWREVPWYLGAQLLGAVLGSFAVSVLLGSSGSDLGGTVPAVGLGASLGIEFVLTFSLMFIIMGVATDHRAQGMMAGVAIGGMVALAAMVGGPLTGASMNPARSFGPALMTGNFAGHWVYWVGPILGSICGAILYQYFQCHQPGEEGSSGCC